MTEYKSVQDKQQAKYKADKEDAELVVQKVGNEAVQEQQQLNLEAEIVEETELAKHKSDNDATEGEVIRETESSGGGRAGEAAGRIRGLTGDGADRAAENLDMVWSRLAQKKLQSDRHAKTMMRNMYDMMRGMIEIMVADRTRR